MRKIKIAFLGGCMNHQKGIDADKLYHSITSSLLSKIDIDNQMSLHSYRSYDDLLNKSKRVIKETNPDIFCLFIRHFPLFPLHKPIIKFEKINGNAGWTLHPQLLTRRLAWNKRLTEFQSMNDYIFARRRRIELRDFNILSGILLGLHHWAFKYIKLQVEEIISICKEKKIKLVMVSPVRNPESVLGDLICKKIASNVERFCTKNHTSYVNISKFSLYYFESDKVHLNTKGHRLMGELIYEQIIARSLSPLPPVSRGAIPYSVE
jgi:hypothetical protein